jgi:XapX domain-containing protein
MRLYLVSLLIGVLVGALYGLCGVRSPAPPVVALLGLLGMLAGEQAVGRLRPLLHPTSVSDEQSR